MPSVHHVVLDTDLGSDVDDALALAQLAGLPGIDLLGVTTVYGDTLLRARLARRYLSLAGRDVPVHAGLSEPFSGREVWWAGHEGSLHTGLAEEAVDGHDAVGFLLDAVLARPGEVDIVAIGPLTNLAAAIERDARFAPAVRGLWVMGGAFGTGEPEHNLRSDVVAARRVFDARIPTVVTGLEVTRTIEIRGDRLERIAGAGALGEALRADIAQWWEFWAEEWNVPHDPVTVLTLVRPDLFGFSEPGRIELVPSGEDVGRSTFVPDPDGWIRIATTVRSEEAGDEIVAAIRRAGTGAAVSS